ncbi:MAG: 4-(cytidine 5'-diphospho)-2-C-methyl-D-erythritol kinase [Kiritimatiellae bacterium]|nr:4-(cytidine 5'-diphospho)-2-C-methyl-D-erythritol kinase [Kiritimatiellia bacterium]
MQAKTAVTTKKRVSTTTMKIEAFAKVNFTLEVLGVRDDGYHALRSLVVPISLCDTLEITEAETLESDTGYADDLCLKAARVLSPDRGAAIRVIKRIPAGGGLGGGSADAAATLVALNGIWGLGKSRDELVRLAAQVGSDVPALVHGGAVLMEGRGEKVSPFMPEGVAFPRLHMVLCNPGVASSTKEVYAKCNSRVTDDASILYNMRTALASGSLERISAAMMNDLQEPAVSLHPEIGGALELLRKSGVIGAAMSGSGSTVFGLVQSEAHGRETAAFLNLHGFAAWYAQTVP